MEQRTYGETRTHNILSKLPSNQFIYLDEPRIQGPQGTTRYPDFVLVVRSRGILAVEVKDWKKIIIEESDQNTIKIVNVNGEARSFNNPVNIARGYSHNLMNLFEKRRELLAYHGGVEKLSFPCDSIVILPHQDHKTIKRMEEAGIFPKNKVFPGNSLTCAEEFIKYIDQINWIWQLRQPISTQTLEIIKKTMGIKNVRSEKDNAKIGDLNRNQEEVVFSPLPSRDGGFSVDLIRGSVGSGKTIVLTKRADLLADIRPDLKILVTAFQIDLMNDLRKRIQNPRVKVIKFFDICKEILGDRWPMTEKYRDDAGPATIKNWVSGWADFIHEKTIDPETVAQEIARRKDISLISDTDYISDVTRRSENFSSEQIEIINALFDLYSEYQENAKAEGREVVDYEDIPDLTLKALFGHEMERSFDVIMIDEAQDWAPKWIQIIKRLLKPGGYLMLCDDPAQSLWRFFNWDQKGIKNFREFFLELPERTTCQIMTFAQSLFDIDDRLHVGYDMDVYPVKTDHLLQGQKPTVKVFTNKVDEIAGVILDIESSLKKGVLYSEIGILCSSSDDASFWKNNPIVLENNIYVSHFNLMKGLEFHTVIIPHLKHSFHSNSFRNGKINCTVLRKLFVAITRAKKSVYLSTYGEFPVEITPILVYASVEHIV